jgi:hypothetical protein
MTAITPPSFSPLTEHGDAPVWTLARRLAAAGLGTDVSRREDTWQLTIVGLAAGKSLLTLNTRGQARWYYEPAAGPATSPATLIAIIAHLLRASPSLANLAAYHALPLKGQVGRALQDAGLTVTLTISEDPESFEATTDIHITSPTRPQLGTITLSDDAAIDWRCDLRAAFPANPATLIETIIPILRAH